MRQGLHSLCHAGVLTALALAGIALASGPSWAGAGAGALVSSNPADHAALGDAPTEVRLTFSEPPDLSESTVTVLDQTISTVNANALRPDGPDGLIQPVLIVAPGPFAVSYHIVFAGGGQLNGTLQFSVLNGTPLSSAARAEQVPPLVAGPGGAGIAEPLAIWLLVFGTVGITCVIVLREIRFRLPRDPAAATAEGPDATVATGGPDPGQSDRLAMVGDDPPHGEGNDPVRV